ncbi:MAG TPA: tetratricopeptide repeat protein, partial [Thermoanaerobaculia bacterium]|nr:tetratricopeptide repeat protein [Thermoanaerobaculia bacterium]
YDESITRVREAIERNPDTEGAYYLLGRALFAAGRYQELADIADEAIAHSGDNYNAMVPINNALKALGKKDAVLNHTQRQIQMFESQLKKVPEDARARVLLAVDYAYIGRPDEALAEVNLAMTLRPDDALIMYNVACVLCTLKKKPEALIAIRKAYDAGFRDPNWARHDTDLVLLHDEPEFNRMYPPSQ